MSATLRLLLALLLLHLASASGATTPGSFAGTWGGTWSACIYEGSGAGCPGTVGHWTATIADDGHFMATLENCGPEGVCTMVGTVTPAGVLDVGRANYVNCGQSLVIHLGLNPRSARGEVSCSVTENCSFFRRCTYHHQLSVEGGEISLHSGNYQGLWWGSPAGAQSGWGVNLAHQGDVLFATWFSYNHDGSGMWLVVPNGVKAADGAYSGTLYQSTGPAFDAQPWDPAQVKLTAVGKATFMFADADNGTFIYALYDSPSFPWPYGSGVQFQAKTITRLGFSSPMPKCEANGAAGPTPNYGDLWWNSPGGSESGWGVNISHQGDILFATWFTYDAKGKGMWLVMSNGQKTGQDRYAGALYRTTGPSFGGVPWFSSSVKATEVGTAAFTFIDADNGVFSYVVNGVTQSKPITRLSFAAPPTVCH